MIGISRLCCADFEGADEYRYRPFPRERKPVVVWNCTKACNLKCCHCYAKANPSAASDELSTGEAKAMIDDLAAFGSPVILFSGGEPCLRGDIFELLDYAAAKGIRTVLSTNGTLISSDSARRLAEVHLSYAGISIDGAEKTHDDFRGVKGAFAKTVEGIRNCRAAGVRTGLRMTINRSNQADIPFVFDFLRSEALERACFYHLVYSGRGSALVSEDLSHEETRAAVKTIIDETRKTFAMGFKPEILTVDNHADGPFVYGELLKSDPERARKALEILKLTHGNSSGNGIGCIGWDGEVYADQFWRHRSFGNIRKTPFSEIWTSEALKPLKDKRPYLKGRCAACRWLDICGGNFRVRAEAVTGDIWAPDPACYLTDGEIA